MSHRTVTPDHDDEEADHRQWCRSVYRRLLVSLFGSLVFVAVLSVAWTISLATAVVAFLGFYLACLLGIAAAPLAAPLGRWLPVAACVALWYVALTTPWWLVRGPVGFDFRVSTSRPTPVWLRELLGFTVIDNHWVLLWTAYGLVGFTFHLAYALALGGAVDRLRRGAFPGRQAHFHLAVPPFSLALSYGLAVWDYHGPGVRVMPWIGSWACLAGYAVLLATRQWPSRGVEPRDGDTS